MKKQKRKLSIINGLLGAIVASGSCAGVYLTASCSSASPSYTAPSSNPNLHQNGSLQTEQPIIVPPELPKTDLTNYILSQTTAMKDKAEVSLKQTIIKDYINKNFADTINANVNSVELVQDGNYTPVRYFVKLHLDKPTEQLTGFDATDGDETLLTSTTYYPSCVLSDNVIQNQFKGFNQQALFYKKVINTHSRTPMNDVYQTKLMDQYGKYGFQYPGYNCNYELVEENKPMSNGYLTIPGQTDKIDMIPLVLNERVPEEVDNKGELVYKDGYADAKYIKKEIAAGTFKKHPAANNFYNQNVLPDTLAVDTQFTISSAPGNVRSLGLYAPAGEILTFQLSKEEFERFKASNASVEILINENY